MECCSMTFLIYITPQIVQNAANCGFIAIFTFCKVLFNAAVAFNLPQNYLNHLYSKPQVLQNASYCDFIAIFTFYMVQLAPNPFRFGIGTDLNLHFEALFSHIEIKWRQHPFTGETSTSWKSLLFWYWSRSKYAFWSTFQPHRGKMKATSVHEGDPN